MRPVLSLFILLSAPLTAQSPLPGDTIHGRELRRLPTDILDDVLRFWTPFGQLTPDGVPRLRGGSSSDITFYVDGIPLRGVHPGLISLEGVVVRTGVLPTRLGDVETGAVELVPRTVTGGWTVDAGWRTDVGRQHRGEAFAGGSLIPGVSLNLGGVLRTGSRTPAAVRDVTAFTTSGGDTTVTGFGGEPVDLPAWSAWNESRLPYESRTDLQASARLVWTYGAGAVTLTALRTDSRARDWPGASTFNASGQPASAESATALLANWSHQFGRVTIGLGAARQRRRVVSGPLDSAWVVAHDDPGGSFWFSDPAFLVVFDHFSDDSGPGAIPALVHDADFDQLVTNLVTNSGTRAPYLDRNDLRQTQPYRLNPWGAETGFPTQGLGAVGVRLRTQRSSIGKATVDVAAAAGIGLHLGADLERTRINGFSGSLLNQSNVTVLAEDPAQLGLFAGWTVDRGRLSLELGVRWDRYDPHAAFPVIPGRIFTHPAFDPADPFDPSDSVLVTAPAVSALSPRLRGAVTLGPGTSIHAGIAKQARHPSELALEWRLRDLAFTGIPDGVGAPLPWHRAILLEAGVRQRIGQAARVALTAFVLRSAQPAVLGRTIFDPVTGRDRTAFTTGDRDTARVTGIDADVTWHRRQGLSLGLAYSYQHEAAPSIAGGALRPHTVAAWIGLRTPESASILGSWEGTATARVTSGVSYTRVAQTGTGIVAPFDPTFGGAVEPANSSRTPWLVLVDARLDRSFTMAGGKWEVFADVRNMLGRVNRYGVFAETGTDDNALHRSVVIAPEIARLESDAGSRLTQIDREGRSIKAIDLGADCNTWSDGAVNCVLLRRAESRWGNGDGVYDEGEYTAAFDAMYDLFFGPWTRNGNGRTLRLGVELHL